MRNTATLSDGSILTVRTERTVAGYQYRVRDSREFVGETVFVLVGSTLCLALPDASSLIPIDHERYGYADTAEAGARQALRFCVDSAEDTIAYANREGISVCLCY